MGRLAPSSGQGDGGGGDDGSDGGGGGGGGGELDGDEHGPMALEMISELCGSSSSKWKQVTDVAKECLEKRIQLWDTISEEIKEKGPYSKK